MTLESLSHAARSLWVVWMMLLFLGIVAWAFWPGRKSKLNAYGRIPLDDEPDSEA